METEIFILFYDKYEKKFRLGNNGISELVDNVLLTNVTLFVAPMAQEIIKERASHMSNFEAKFPHAFAIGNKLDFDLFMSRNKEINWRDFDYDVFKNNFFFLKDSNESLENKKVKYLMVQTTNEGDLRRVILK